MTDSEGTIDGIDCRVNFDCELPDACIRRIEFRGKMMLES